MSDENFEKALKEVLKYEGGFVNLPQDPGGATNFGISLRLLQSIDYSTLRKCGFNVLNSPADISAIKNMTEDQAKNIYKILFWDSSKCPQIKSDLLRVYIFDMIVNMGSSNATKCIQRALWCYNLNSLFQGSSRVNIIDDGIFGEKTINAINAIDSQLLFALKAERASYYKILALKNPDQRIFLEGWLNRTYGDK